jgi:hypothetical protein
VINTEKAGSIMNVNINKVYLYDHVWELRAIGDTLCLCKDTGPMNNLQPLKAHKGVDNELIFRVLGPDRNPVDVACGYQVFARIVDTQNRDIVFEKLCYLGPAKGLVKLKIDAGDIIDLPAGMYQMVLVRTQEFISDIPGYYVEKPLFTDYNDNITMQIEITEQGLVKPPVGITLLPGDWTPDLIVPIMGAPQPCFYSPRIPGARVLNHKDSVHSFSTYTQGFTGTLEIWGTLEETPDAYLNSTRWVKIYPSSLATDIQYINYTGTQAWTFQANFMWLKFRYFPSKAVLDPGTLDKLIVRM